MTPQRLRLFFLAGLVLSGCSQSPVDTRPPTSPPPSDPSTSITCITPRPEMCTKEYRPVCATRDSGVRCVTTPCPSTETATYGNACDACADPKVTSHRQGACPD